MNCMKCQILFSGGKKRQKKKKKKKKKITDLSSAEFAQCVVSVVVVQIFNATRHLRHMGTAAIVMYMYLYSPAFMNHPCTPGAAVCHQVPPCPLYAQPWACRV